MLKTFYLYHTNDIHSHFLHWPKIAAYLKDARRRHQYRNEPVLQFDIGDHLDRAHPMTEGTSGQGNVQLLNDVGYDGATIGNNEGITLKKTDLEHLYDEANFPVLVANLFDEENQQPKNMQAYGFFRLENGLTVAAIGITIPFSAFYESLDWHIEDPLEALDSWIREVNEQADIVILLSHMGYFFDQQVAREHDGIDIILGGHTHHLLRQGLSIQGTTIGQAGKFGHYVGEMKVDYDTEKRQVVSCESKAVAIEEYHEDSETKALLARLVDEGNANLHDEVAVLEEPLEVSWFEDSPFADLLVCALKEWCDAEIGMVNAGILLESLPKGQVTKADLHRLCPHPINPCKLQIRGDELREIIRETLTDEMKHLQIKGLGFRGEVMGKMVFDGVKLHIKNGRLYEAYVFGAPLDSDRYYEVATIDMFTLGKMFPGLSKKPVQYFLPEMLRDVLAWKLKSCD